ncbi:DUF305 domain-containing protein [Microbacterium imperiale]|uniref:DUF305 domain-containing protein n=1 Tax=Microbacterium imperiale TaxID=33884 RepID=A0A9W6HHN9_9MICO|nr:DUF305 domain-containing protein [Microbacterium imperiale]MBP2420686.1 hypothetical protein [Microbacterium imperiale]MDS0200507.1 DUF305 domain-containing protein [Microbacterium imperiale]BFE41026.1 hypothetical protein GCM10017544_19820 [Microbacterium imperiale]GLJ80007.1 hypothetical protein GCM10017586_16900 [Microbacterium imperiale]
MSEHAKEESTKSSRRPYLRFAAMIVTGMAVMYWTMFAGTWELSHIRFSESRVFMTLTMGGTMVLVMLAWMWGMYKSVRANIAVIVAGLLLIGSGIALDRSQATVDDTAFMNGMIPHHSLAITRSERAHLTDVRVCELAASISATQREEILTMSWLVDDIAQNGPATTTDEAQRRPAPDFARSADRRCAGMPTDTATTQMR